MCFEIVWQKTLENIQKNIYYENLLIKLHDYSLQPTYGQKTPLGIPFRKCSERNGSFKVLNFSKKIFHSFLSTSLILHKGLESRQKHCQSVSYDCYEIAETLPGKVI